ncbi:MAG: MFS transporter [Desulfovibrionaceae bacterium]|nr:MFS transporter [Desulfovibrionaceae bacterium]
MLSHLSGRTLAMLSCAYAFACIGLNYGSLMSRIPALKHLVSLSETQIGTALLCLGIGCLCALALAGRLIARIGSRKLLKAALPATILINALNGWVPNAHGFFLTMFLTGVSIGLCEAPMNTQAMLIERRWGRASMSSLHASFSFGGLAGSMFGSFFVLAGIAPGMHFCCISLLLLFAYPLLIRNLEYDKKIQDNGEALGKCTETSIRIPPFILLCGVLAMCSYAAEGSVAEWGGLLLYQVKQAPEFLAALVFAAFSIPMAICRFFGDRLREKFGDFLLFSCCSVIATAGMATALFVPWPLLSLGGYAVMGAGLSVIVPILFSEAGKRKDISPGSASATISILAYGGQLVIPPLLGISGNAWGIENALLLVLLLCLLLCLGSIGLRSSNRS